MTVFEGKTEPLEKEYSGVLTTLLLQVNITKSDDMPGDKELPFTSKVVKKRIEVMKLPIEFTDAALLSIDIFTQGNPGRAVVFLIDALTKFENGIVSLNDVCEKLYPMGFYTEEALEEYIDGCKDRKYKWSEIY